MTEHHDIDVLIAGAGPTGSTLVADPDYLRMMETLFSIMDTTTLSDTEKFTFTVQLYNYVINFSVDEYEQRVVTNAISAGSPPVQTNYSEFTIIDRMYQRGMFQLIGSEELFVSGVELLLVGMEQKVFARQK